MSRARSTWELTGARARAHDGADPRIAGEGPGTAAGHGGVEQFARGVTSAPSALVARGTFG